MGQSGHRVTLSKHFDACRTILALVAFVHFGVSETGLLPAQDQVQAQEPQTAAAIVQISGELRQWHPLTFTCLGPSAGESDTHPNPFLDYRFTITFTHASNNHSYVVPGYFAADGNAAESGAETGARWRTHFAADMPGRWRYAIEFVTDTEVAINGAAGTAIKPLDGQQGEFQIEPTNKTGRDFRAQGRLQYVGKHYLQFAGTGQYFLKVGADAPETLLAYSDFDGTQARKKAAPLKSWTPHRQDWRDGDPSWRNGRGKGLIGALNYLASTGCNAISFIPYNAGGDGDNVWPFVTPTDPLHYDCSKLDQWQIVFTHAQNQGLFLHFKLQETENDDNRHGKNDASQRVSAALDGGDLAVTRKLYCRELVARFGHLLALNWNLGEENTQSPEQQRAMAQYIADLDPYDHLRVVHTFPNQQDKVYPPLLGDQSALTGASLQNSWSHAHQRTLQWVQASAAAGKPWVVANDEQNPADQGVPPDPGYEGFSGKAQDGKRNYDLHDIRKYTLWGTLLAGGAGVEYYFGYKLPQNDLLCEDFRSRAESWRYGAIALQFFQQENIPFWEMTNADERIGNPKHSNDKYCLAKIGACYLIYLPTGGTTQVKLPETEQRFQVRWFNPRTGGGLQTGSVRELTGGGSREVGLPPSDPEQDWLVVIRQ